MAQEQTFFGQKGLICEKPLIHCKAPFHALSYLGRGPISESPRSSSVILTLGIMRWSDRLEAYPPTAALCAVLKEFFCFTVNESFVLSLLSFIVVVRFFSC